MDVSNELIAIAIVGVGLAGFVWNLSRDVRRVEVELRERMARVEGLLEGLRDSISGRREEGAR
jgi:type II secretory pathway pseudopilin PulG